MAGPLPHLYSQLELGNRIRAVLLSLPMPSHQKTVADAARGQVPASSSATCGGSPSVDVASLPCFRAAAGTAMAEQARRDEEQATASGAAR